MSAPRISAIVCGKRAISADTALRLGTYFKMEPQFCEAVPATHMESRRLGDDLKTLTTLKFLIRYAHPNAPLYCNSTFIYRLFGRRQERQKSHP